MIPSLVPGEALAIVALRERAVADAHVGQGVDGPQLLGGRSGATPGRMGVAAGCGARVRLA